MTVAKHTAYNLLGSLVPIVVSLVTVPLYLRVIGLERFGILSICWLLLGYFGLFDLGLGRAVSQRIAALADAGAEARSKVFWTGFWISGALAAVAALILYPVVLLALGQMRFDSAAVAAEVGAAVPWLTATVPVAMLGGIFSGALTGRARFGLLNVVEGVSTSLTVIAPLACAWLFGPQLWILVAAALGARLLAAILMFAACFREIPLRGPNTPDRATVRSLLVFGAWVTVGSICGPVLAFWDRFAIGFMISAAAVSVYVIPFTLVWRLVIIPGALSRALFPRFAALAPDEGAALHVRSLHALATLMTPAILLCLFCARPFLDLWIGPELGAQCARVAYLLLPGLWINSFGHVLYSWLHARERPDLVSKLLLAEMLPYMAVLFGALLLFGIEGAALAWTLRVTSNTIVLLWLSDVGLRRMTWLLPTAFIVVAATAAALFLPALSVAHWLALALALLAGSAMAYRDRPPELREMMDRLLRRSTVLSRP
ncbi:MAG TPA: oligosaccharide flippase family protein [Allosphingosinicella sp.]|nr:oligosaccharide flippase family protein [Allosphingosinicella sp.]